MQRGTDEYDEIIIENEYEHIYAYKNGEAVEIVPPHSPEFKQERENILRWDMCVANNTEYEVRLVRKS